MKRFYLSVKGIVQGVGFRPFVYNLAKELGIKGYIKNTSGGVFIEAEGDNCAGFIDDIQRRHPPLAKIECIQVQELSVLGYDDFVIISSSDSDSFTLVSPDVSVCDSCMKELSDPQDRRYLYPFINCTDCGPRYSITKRVPYDRPNTTMAQFRMCPQCMSEYKDPCNRRFHAQPNACPRCGPQVFLTVNNPQFTVDVAGNPIAVTIALLKQGALVAVKGLGGFHLCCDASNERAVKHLREKKRRSNKPFALMSPDCGTVGKFCEISEDETVLLNDIRRPIVLLKKKVVSDGSSVMGKNYKDILLPYDVAPNNKYLGFMLPYTPLHYLLFHHPLTNDPLPISCNFDALVMTSGNISEEPIVIDNIEAVSKLSDIADAFLFHNRDIFMRVDDSVLRVRSHRQWVIGDRQKDESNGTKDLFSVPMTPDPLPMTFFIRRSRGYVPEPIVMKDDGPDVLGCGADVKNAFTIMKGNYAIMSQHIGDMENIETLRFFEETLLNLKHMYRSQPVALAYDLHPRYLSTQWALEQISKHKMNGYAVQHHYAHIASVLAESGLKDEVIGIALDGTGYGTDGNLWGGEFLVCSINGFIRIAHFNYIPLPGGEMAIKECWRTAVGLVVSALSGKESGSDRLNAAVMESLEAAGFIDRYGRQRVETIVKLAGKRQFSPLSSGSGRLFDAVSALAGVSDRNTFEGEAAIALENEIEEGFSGAYPFSVNEIHETGRSLRIDFSETVFRIIGDIKNGELKGRIAAKFHNTVIEVIAAMAALIRGEYGIRNVALSGGTFQNAYVFERAYDKLKSQGFNVFTNVNVPCNDACISLGQAFLLRERLKAGVPLKD
jgi:hydrogenase maturation protein HypF